MNEARSTIVLHLMSIVLDFYYYLFFYQMTPYMNEKR